ncbi:MAG: amino acid adenylation domain-containing protein [Bryobacteraceae bacterium]
MAIASNSPGALSLEEKRRLIAELLAAEDGSDLHPLTSAQRRIWFLEQMDGVSSGYNLSPAVALTGAIDRSALEKSFTAMLARHESLRTVLVVEGDTPMQRFLAPAAGTVEYVDLRSLPPDQRQTSADGLISERAGRPFDIYKGPLIRLTLFQIEDARHILLISAHHIIVDGVSLGIFVHELGELYDAEVTGRDAALPELPVEYADFIDWKQSALEGGSLRDQIEYWKRRLAGAPELLELPADRVRPAEQSYSGDSIDRAIPEQLVEEASALGSREQATVFSVLLTCFIVLLYRYTRQEDISVGVPLAGRNRLETENLVGLLMNMVVIRTDLSGPPAFVDVLRQVRDSLLEATENQDVPFQKLIEELNPRRSLAYNPIFQVLATSFSAQLTNRRFGPLEASPYPVDTGTAMFEITSAFTQDARGSWQWDLNYNTHLFDRSRMERMIRHFEILLSAALRDPGRAITELPLLTQEETAQMARFNDTATPFPHACVPELIRAVARQNPDRVAVQFEGRSLSYRELDVTSDRLARVLRNHGAVPGDLIALCVSRSIEMVVGLLAILKGGCAYVPMDPDYPVQRLLGMLEDSGAKLLLTERDLVHELQRAAADVAFVDDTATETGHSDLEEDIDPESLAYVIYTSGSTGKPKGVAIPHRAVVNLLCSMRRAPGFTADDTLLAVTTVCFDIAGLELYLPLITGGRVVIASRETALDGRALLHAVRRYGITVMQATPTTWRLLIEAGWDGTQPLKVLCGGEALPVDLANQLTQRSASVWNVYGPTETTIWSACIQLHTGQPVTIGRPIDNTGFYILDGNLQPVPIGVNGELYIGGSGLARGYWNRSELTSEKFVSIPGVAGGATLYRTGDEVRLLENGTSEYQRRIDFQVKVRGFRIELGEIETALAAIEGVMQAVVTVREDTPGDRRLVAYVIPRPAASLSRLSLQDQLKRTLPDYMVPYIMTLEAFPLTSNGKVDRNRLPAPETAPASAETIAPRTQVEAKLVEIWQEILRVPSLGVRDDFFDQGGHSLLAVRLLARVRDVFDTEIPLATMFHEPTVEHMASAIEERKRPQQRPSSVIALRTEGSKPPLFLGGSTPAYLQLAQVLGEDQPVYKMDLYALGEQVCSSAGRPYETFSQYVDHFLADIRKIQPTGPYYLGGGCDGGVLALEVARQLQRLGQEVGLLLIWETPRTGYFEPRRIAGAVHLARRAAQSLAAGELPWIRRNRLARESEAARQLTPEQERYLLVYDTLWTAITNFRSTAKFAGRVEFLQAEKQFPQYHDTSHGWDDLATFGVRIHTIPGDHDSYFKEHFDSYATAVRGLLLQAQGEADPGGERMCSGSTST